MRVLVTHYQTLAREGRLDLLHTTQNEAAAVATHTRPPDRHRTTHDRDPTKYLPAAKYVGPVAPQSFGITGAKYMRFLWGYVDLLNR